MSDANSHTADEPLCHAQACPVQGQAEPAYICKYCGDVTDAMECPQATPKQARDGTDI